MTATVDLFTVGAAMLALWLTYRFPSAGPQSLVSALLLTVAAFALLSLMASAAHALVVLLGPTGALLFDVLPGLTFVFWAWACLARALIRALAPLRR